MANRNSEAHFELAPQVMTERSTFDQNFNHKTTFDVGELIPFYVQEILPGDTAKIQTNKVTRLQTLITPVMDDLFLDTYYFFVPNRLVWEHWEEFCGANKQSAWAPTTVYSIPQVRAPYSTDTSVKEELRDDCWHIGTIADHMGLPVGISWEESGLENGYSFNALPFRAYAKIVDDWFRDENLQDPIWIPTGDSAIDGSNGDNYITDLVKGGKPFIAAKYHDYFTSALPQPQKGDAISFLPDYLPVVPVSGGNVPKPTGVSTQVRRLDNGSATGNGNIAFGNGAVSVVTGTVTSPIPVYFSNLFASNNTSGTTINDLRQAFMVQRLLEVDARSGSRYIEVLKAHFSVTSPDARLQRAEYLGGNRIPFNIEQVLQTSSTDQTTPQGNVAGWSQTADSHYDVNKSFVEHGYLIGLCVARYRHSYQQGVMPMWTRELRFDFYWPELAHLGEKPIYNREIVFSGIPTYDNGVFGYQEAWAEYRYMPNQVSGLMRANYDWKEQDKGESLDYWHFGDFYLGEIEGVKYPLPPALSADWIHEDKANVDRTLAVSSEVSPQILADIFLDVTMTRPLPLYSIPGLMARM